MFAARFTVPFAVTIPQIRWLAICACLLAITPAKALAQQACVFTESQFQGTPRCFSMDTLTDVPDGIKVKSVRVDPGAELIVGTGTQLGGTFTRFAQSVSHPAFSGYTDAAYRSFQVRPRACIYVDAQFKGRETCFVPGPLEPELSGKFDRNVSSARITRGLALYAFSGRNGTGDSTFHYGDAKFLRSFNDKARSLQLVRWVANCFEDCLIPYSEGYDLDKVVYTSTLKSMHGKWHRLSQVVATFAIDSRQSFTVNVGNTVEFRFSGAAVTATYRQDTINTADFRLDDGTAYVSIALGFGNDKNDLDHQLVASDASRRFIKASPIATVALTPGRASQTFAIDSESSRLVRLKALSFAQVARRAWMQPANACWNTPLLSAAMHFTGPCSAGTPGLAAADTKGIAFSAGAQPWRHHMAVNPASVARSPVPPTVLKSFVWGHNPLARYAASKVCRQPAAQANAHRVRRNPDDPSACVGRTMTIIALYQALFGPHWNAADFQAVIDSILTHGTTGYASSQPELESELIEAVRRQAGATASDTRRQTAMTAFYAADRLLQSSRNGSPDLEQAQWRTDQAGAGRWIPSASAPATIDEARQAVLGHYRLDLRRYQPFTVLPRTYRDGHWQPDAMHPFEIEFLTRADEAAIRHVRAVVENWADTYRAIAATDHSLPGDQLYLANAGATMAASLYGAIANGESGVYVVVHYQGQPVAVLLTQIDEDRPTIAEIDTVVSLPRNVMHRGQAAVRGAGSAALHAALTYLQGLGVTEVSTHAASTPSAIVKRRAGFQLLIASSDASSSDSDQ